MDTKRKSSDQLNIPTKLVRAGRGRPPKEATNLRKHVTLPPEMLTRLEQEAAQHQTTISEVIAGHVASDWQAGQENMGLLGAQVAQLSADMADFRAKVLPLVATVTALLRQMEGELPVKGDAPQAEPPIRVVPYEEMYADEQSTSEPPVETQHSVDLQKIKRRWKLSIW